MEPEKSYIFRNIFCKISIWVGVFFSFSFSVAQESNFVVPDSLKQYSYVELFRAYQKVDKDTIKSKEYLYTILKNSELKKDSLRMAVAYCYLSHYATNDTIKLALLDTAIDVSKNLGNKTYPAKAYSWKGAYYMKKGVYQKALDAYMRTLTLSAERGNAQYLQFTKHNIGLIKTRIGKHDEALKLLREHHEYAKSKYEPTNQAYLNSLFSLAESYTYNQKTDSAAYYNTNGVAISQSSEKLIKQYYGKFVLNEGFNQYFDGNYIIAFDSIVKGLDRLDTKEQTNKSSFILGRFYLGKINLIKGDIVGAEREFVAMDSIVQKEKMPLMPIREAYEFLINFYKTKNQKEQQLAYIDKLLWFDDKIYKANTSISNRLFKEFDTPLLLQEKEKLIQELRKNTSNLSLLVTFFILMFLMTGGVLYYQFVKRKKYEQKFNELVQKNKREPIKSFTTLNNIGIANEVVDDLLDKLLAFEKEHQYLQRNLSIAVLAKEMGTNSKYLSKVINSHKSKSFTNYINDLRIAYSVQQLQKSTTLQNYTIQGIAEEMGFNNAESFSSAFKKNTGIKPSYFMRKLQALDTE